MTQGKRQAGSRYLTQCVVTRSMAWSLQGGMKRWGEIIYNQKWEPFPSTLISREKRGLIRQSRQSVSTANTCRSHVIQQPGYWWESLGYIEALGTGETEHHPNQH